MNNNMNNLGMNQMSMNNMGINMNQNLMNDPIAQNIKSIIQPYENKIREL